MKKARIAPMVKRLPQENPNSQLEKYEKLNDDEVKLPRKSYKADIQQKWISALKNTTRLRKKYQKCFEEINGNLLKEKMSLVRISMECLLETWGESLKRRRQEKPKLHKGSLANRDISKTLLVYFMELATIEDDELRVVDFDYLKQLFTSGVDVNVTDRYGQSIMHEVARIWHVDVARFMIKHGIYF